MYKVLEKSAYKIRGVKMDFLRYLLGRMDLQHRFIAITGARGTGKTTLLLQLGKRHNSLTHVLYVCMSDLYFSTNSLHDLAKRFVSQGGKVLMLDDLHTHPNWPNELRRLYVDFEDLQVIFAASSIIDLQKHEREIGRKVAHYPLKELSFREYLHLHKGIQLPTVSLEDIRQSHQTIATNLAQQFAPLDVMSDYLKFGAYPYYQGDGFVYHQRLLTDIVLTFQADLPTTENIDYSNVLSHKRLLQVLAAQVPYTPNVLQLSARIGLTRNATVRALQVLDKLELVHALYAHTKPVTVLNKPDRVWLRNTNMMYAIAGNTKMETVRDTFLLQHLAHEVHLNLTQDGNLLLNEEHTLVLDGRRPSKKPLSHNGWRVQSDSTVSDGEAIPLWLFGLVY